MSRSRKKGTVAHEWHSSVHVCRQTDTRTLLGVGQTHSLVPMASNAMSRIENQGGTCLVQILLSHTFLP